MLTAASCGVILGMSWCVAGALPLQRKMPEDRDQFTRVEVLAGDRVFIRSTCRDCGASRLVSSEDDALEKWESGHDCSKGSSTLL